MALITCIISDDALKQLIAEIRRTLRPGGFLYIGDFLLNTDERNIARYEQAFADTGVYGAFTLPEGAALRHFRAEFIRELPEGFSEKHFSEESYVTMNGHASRGFTWLGLKLQGKKTPRKRGTEEVRRAPL